MRITLEGASNISVSANLVGCPCPYKQDRPEVAGSMRGHVVKPEEVKKQISLTDQPYREGAVVSSCILKDSTWIYLLQLPIKSVFNAQFRLHFALHRSSELMRRVVCVSFLVFIGFFRYWGQPHSLSSQKPHTVSCS